MNDHDVSQHDLDKPATFRSSPGAEAMNFDRLIDALRHIVSRGSNRHPRAVLAVRNIELNWAGIDQAIARFGLSSQIADPLSTAPRSSRR